MNMGNDEFIKKELAGGPLRVAELEKRAVDSGQMSKPTYYNWLTKLEKSGDIVRVQDGKLMVWVALKEHGSELLQKMGLRKIAENVSGIDLRSREIVLPELRLPTPVGKIMLREQRIRMPILSFDPPIFPLFYKARRDLLGSER